MTDALSLGTGGGTPISQVLGQLPAKTSTAGSSELGQDAFLKLLVAQLKYQDPTNPSDGAEFLAQTAQFTQVEKLNQLAEEQKNLVNSQLMLSASNLVGRTVTYTGADGVNQKGIVTSATFGGSNSTVKVGYMDVPLSSVKEVHHSA